MAELKKIQTINHDDLQKTKGLVNTVFYQLHPNLFSENGDVSKTVRQPVNANTEEPEDICKMSNVRIIKNLLVLSFGFLCLFTAFNSLSNLQSSVNQSLGTLSLSAIYAALVLSCMFVPSIMIGLLGEKFTMIVSMVMYTFYFVANFYPRWYTLVPASIVLGLGGAPLWAASGSYLTTIAERYATRIGQPVEVFVVRFFGIFFTIFQMCNIWGNLISYKVLAPKDAESQITVTNHSSCGGSYCDVWMNDTESNLNSTIPPNFNFLCGIYTGCALLAILIMLVLLDPLEENSDRKVEKPSLRTLVDTFHHMKHPYQLLLIPLTIFGGLFQAYITGDFTKAFVTCGWGVYHVGYVLICFGVMNAVCSLAVGILKKPGCRPVIILLGTAITTAMIILMFLWHPSNDDHVLYFVTSGFLGVGDAVFGTYINAFYGVLFPDSKEAAFSNFRLWQSLGYIIAFAYSSYLCIPVKLAILAGFLVVGICGYVAVEIHEHLAKRKLDKAATGTTNHTVK